MKLRGQASGEAFSRNNAYLRAERTRYQEEIERQHVALATLAQSTAALNTLEHLRGKIAGNLESATPDDKRWVPRTLGVRGTVRHDGWLEISLGVPGHLVVPEERASNRNAQGLRIA